MLTKKKGEKYLKNYIILVAAIIIVLSIVVLAVKKCFMKSNAETDISTTMITSGISLMVAAFPGTKELVLSFVAEMADKDITYETDPAMIICGVILITFGILYKINIRDRIYILNMFGIPVQKEISDDSNIKDLKLADFKVKEILIDFVDVFNINMTQKTNEIIVKKIQKVCTAFINRSNGFKSCFTGMAPIPYTILAGTYLASGKVRRYFEYRRADSKYYELSKRKKKNYQKLNTIYPDHPDIGAIEVVVALSVTRKVQKIDLNQFGTMDIIEIGLSMPDDNIIKSLAQLDEYAGELLNQIEGLKQKYPSIQKVHFVASIPSCLSIEIGKRFALNTHRLPQIISYHFVNSGTPKYPFGIIVSDGAAGKGKLIKG